MPWMFEGWTSSSGWTATTPGSEASDAAWSAAICTLKPLYDDWYDARTWPPSDRTCSRPAPAPHAAGRGATASGCRSAAPQRPRRQRDRVARKLHDDRRLTGGEIDELDRLARRRLGRRGPCGACGRDGNERGSDSDERQDPGCPGRPPPPSCRLSDTTVLQNDSSPLRSQVIDRNPAPCRPHTAVRQVQPGCYRPLIGSLIVFASRVLVKISGEGSGYPCGLAMAR